MRAAIAEDNPDLRALWSQHNPDQSTINKQRAIQYIQAVLQNTAILPNFKSPMPELQPLIRQYLQQSPEVTDHDMQNLQLSYPQVVDFLNWLAQDEGLIQMVLGQESAGRLLDELQMEAEKQNQRHMDNKAANIQRNILRTQSQLFQQGQHSQKTHNSIALKPTKFMPSRVQINTQEPKQNTQPVRTKEKQLQDNQQVNQNAVSTTNELDVYQLSKKYKDHLKIIFEHYCKISYATGQDPTFEQIKHKTTVMTINKFMIFCKDFQIASISQTFSRSYLIQIFKKNAECYKQMSFWQFCLAVRKLATAGFSSINQPYQKRDKSESQLLSAQMIKMLQFCEIETFAKFRQKMKRLNIQYRIGPKAKTQIKIIPEAYRFKFASNNGKTQEQIKQQIQERKQHRSQKKILLQQRGNNNLNEASFRKKIKSKNHTSIYQNDQYAIPQTNGQAKSIQSMNILNKILMPPLPPKKLAFTPVNLPKAINQYSPSTSNQPAAYTNIFKKEIGYAQLHKIKQKEGYSRKAGVSKSASHDGKGVFKLNSIVEEARQEVEQTGRVQLSSEQLTESAATNSRQTSMRGRDYDLEKMNSKIQMVNERNRRDRQIKEQLEQLLDVSNDEDQFLRQHLLRQKRNETNAKKLSLRISGLQRLV